MFNLITRKAQSYFLGHYYDKVFHRSDDHIRRLRKLLSDERSVEVFDLLLKSYTSKNDDADWFYKQAAEVLSSETKYTMNTGRVVHEAVNMYFRDEIYHFKERYNMDRRIVLLDGGSYNGDTIVSASNTARLSEKFQIAYAYAFEPDPSNYHQLQRNLRDLSFPVETFNCGLDDHDGKEEFCWEGVRTKINTDGGIYGEGNAAGGRMLSVRNAGLFLDDLKNAGVAKPGYSSSEKDKMSNRPLPNFIKLDIEGREREVILSMSGFIREYHPDLAVSIYHRPEDLWDLPLMIYSICSDYKIYIRHNSDYYTETICHAVYNI